jgi:hypothetical protein
MWARDTVSTWWQESVDDPQGYQITRVLYSRVSEVPSLLELSYR